MGEHEMIFAEGIITGLTAGLFLAFLYDCIGIPASEALTRFLLRARGVGWRGR